MPLSAPTQSTAAHRGIDLAKRYVEIAKIIRKHFTSMAMSAGIDVDDLIQEVAFKLHRADIRVRDEDDEDDQGSVYDHRKGSFSHWIFHIADNQLKTMVVQKRRHPLSDLDVPPEVEDDSLNPVARLVDCEDAARAAMYGPAESAQVEGQETIAATTGPAFRDLGSAVADIQRRQREPRTRRPAPPPGCKRVQMSFLGGTSLGEELLADAAANTNSMKEVS